MRVFPGVASSEVRQRLTDKEQFDQESHEYNLLLQSQFSNLNEQERETILNWIAQGPELQGFIENAKTFTEAQPSEEDVNRYVRRWQLQRLSPLRDAIAGHWKTRYEELLKEFGSPKAPDDISGVVTSWVGPTSPLQSADLRVLSLDALIDYLATWKPEESHHSPTPEGLARELTPVVAADPQRFAEGANRFRGLDPTYVRSLLAGFRDAAGQKHIFGWKEVLELCGWVVGQPRDFHRVESRPLERDPHWGWARKTIAELLEQGFTQGPTEIPFDLRESAWNILEKITTDPEPTPDYEQKYGGSNMDAAHIAINTTRGEAMHAVIYYAYWVRRALDEKRSHQESEALFQNFDEMPEVREVLETHLRTDPSLGVRSVYGRFFPQLYFLDANWTKTHLRTIFPLDESMYHFFEAAWNTYVLFANPPDDLIDVLAPIYAHAMEHLKGRTNEKSHNLEAEHLAARLVGYYWKGKLDVGEDSLLQLFWSKADANLRGYLFENVGRSLANTHGDIPEELLKRLQQLWEFRLAVAEASSDPQQYKEELAGFSWCFTSGKFSDQWAIDELITVLQFTRKIDYPRFVVERLANIATPYPRLVVRCLRLIVESDLATWEIYSWRNEAKQIIQVGIQSGDADARQFAIDLVHRLGAMGYQEFREILA